MTKGQMVSHMILLAIGIIIVAMIALSLHNMKDLYAEDLAKLQAMHLCEKTKFSIRSLWYPTDYTGTNHSSEMSSMSLKLPKQAGNRDYFINLENRTLKIFAQSMAHSCSTGIPVSGSGSGKAQITLSLSRNGNASMIKLK